MAVGRTFPIERAIDCRSSHRPRQMKATGFPHGPLPANRNDVLHSIPRSATASVLPATRTCASSPRTLLHRQRAPTAGLIAQHTSRDTLAS